jgi:LysR family transcriptional regulator, nitrogen assimilation regulatory protein
MEARQLRIFLKIAELGSITRAADALDMAQPSLSQQLLRLEDEVGAKLFRRTTRGVITTEAGRVLEEHARHVLRAMEQALEAVRQLKTEPSGKVTFAMPISISQVIGVPLIDAAIKHAPGVSLCLTEAFSGYIREWLDQGSIDLGILYDVAPLRHLSVKRLAREELYLFGPPGRFGGADAAPVPVQALGELPLILPSQQHGLRQFVDQEAHRMGLTLEVGMEVDSLRHIVHLVAAGHGCSILSMPSAREALDAGQLSLARIGNSALCRTLCLVRNPTRVVTRASVRIEDLAIKLMRQLIIKGRWRAKPEAILG